MIYTFSLWELWGLLSGVGCFLYAVGFFKGMRKGKEENLLDFQTKQEAAMFENYLNTLKGAKHE